MSLYSDEEVAGLIADARAEAKRQGRDEERARIVRCRNACFAVGGLNTAKAYRDAADRFDRMLVRGEEPAVPK